MSVPQGAATFPCHVRYRPGAGPGPGLAPAEVERLSRYAHARATEWGAAICSHLSVPAPEAVTVTLRPHVFVSGTRGTEVLLGVGAGTVSAALAHELVHAVAGSSPFPLYNEGLAVHVDSRLCLAGPAWPFFHLAPDRWVAHFLEDGSFVPLGELMAASRVLPTDEEGVSAATRFYLEAGSFVGFVIGRLGLPGFWPVFRSGGPPADPRLGTDVAAWETAWLAQVGGPLTTAEHRLREASEARVADDGRHGVLPPAGAGPAGRRRGAP